MDEVTGAGTFRLSGDAYDDFMGRYSRPLAAVFADFVGVERGRRAVDVGCGPGALTRVLVDRLGADHVVAVDPSEQFVAACRVVCPGVDVRVGRAEAVPIADGSVEVAVAQLVLHFVSEPAAALAEMRRVLGSSGLNTSTIVSTASRRRTGRSAKPRRNAPRRVGSRRPARRVPDSDSRRDPR